MYCNNTCVSSTVGVAPVLFTSALKYFLAASQCLIQDDFKSGTVKDGEKYHFIIVGGGSAGAVVANRLSEIPDWNILLLEAGSKPPIESYIPNLAGALFGTKYDWFYHAINDRGVSQAFINERVIWPRGKMLGGSSGINALFYVKGNNEDYAIWENDQNPNWNIKNVNKYFKKAESLQNEELKRNPFIKTLYGFDGPQVLNRFNVTNIDIIDNVLESYNEIGFKHEVDLNTGIFKSPGVSGYATVTAANGVRYSTYSSYLLSVKSRKNLNIVINAYVLKILVNDNGVAYGVQVEIDGKILKLFADLEVIVCAGTINTPQLLMLSGIGPREHLESKNIGCKIDLQGVGKNLQDHISIPIPIFGDKPGPLNDVYNYFNNIEYLYNKTGELAQGLVSSIIAFFDRNNNSTRPEFQCHLIIINKNNTDAMTKFVQMYKKSVGNTYLKAIKNKSLYLFLFHNLHPLSRGEILLNTSNPHDKPLIFANYFKNPVDLQVTSDGIRRVTTIVNTPYFKSINAFLQRVQWPECDQYLLDSDLYWQCQAKTTAFTVYHPVGTSKMGPNPSDCVVDNYLKVHGVIGLRIIDASIMPNITSGNTNAPTIMIGEMGADMIKQDYSK